MGLSNGYQTVNKGCIKIGADEQCAGQQPYSIKGDTAQITAKLDSTPTTITVSSPADFGDIFWGEDNCLYDAQGMDGSCTLQTRANFAYALQGFVSITNVPEVDSTTTTHGNA